MDILGHIFQRVVGSCAWGAIGRRFYLGDLCKGHSGRATSAIVEVYFGWFGQTSGGLDGRKPDGVIPRGGRKPMGCKLLFSEKNTDGIRGISINKICASSRATCRRCRSRIPRQTPNKSASGAAAARSGCKPACKRKRRDDTDGPEGDSPGGGSGRSCGSTQPAGSPAAELRTESSDSDGGNTGSQGRPLAIKAQCSGSEASDSSTSAQDATAGTAELASMRSRS